MLTRPALCSSMTRDHRRLYNALEARDARFDGIFFVGVTSTGIYCRPICPAKTTKPANRRFFDSAQEAEQGGFRPCLRCRPELAPGSAPVDDARRIAQLIVQRLEQGTLEDNELEAPDATSAAPAGRGIPSGGVAPRSHTDSRTARRAWAGGRIPAGAAPRDLPNGSLETIARQFELSSRQIRRIVQQELGVPPIQLLLTRRLLLAKQLLTETSLPIAEVAFASGFASLRRFNDAFASRYRMPPSRLRKEVDGPAARATSADTLTLQLSYRPPFDWPGM